jgi:hypothetical protein
MWSPLRNRGLTLKLIPPVIAICAVTGWMTWPQLALSHETLTTTVLFDREIVRILNQHCVMCHVENGPSFPLATYDQTWLQARKIRSDAIARHMPPWSAFPGYGRFINDNGLTLRETQFIVSWVEGSGPRNSGTVFTNTADSNAAPRQQVRAQADFGHWELGEPQLKRQFAANTIEPEQKDEVRRTVVDLGLTSERRVRAVEYMPGDRRVVRAAFFTVQETGQWIGAWTPWYGYLNLGNGSAWRLPAGSHVAAEIYYRGAKEKIVDRGTLGLFFADRPAPKPISDLVLEAKGEVPAGTASQRVRAVTRLAADTDALALRVESQPGVQSIEVSARKLDGTTIVMLFDKNIRQDWPTPFIFKDPVSLPKGAELAVVAYYSNSGVMPEHGGIRLTVATSPKLTPHQ